MTNNEAIGILAIVVETAKGRCFVTDEAISDAYAMAISALQAQEAKHSAESSSTHKALDTISRQAAVDALAKQMPRSYTPDGSHPADEAIFMAQEIYADCITTIERLPSAQPEPLTDKEQRIFLSAMGREEKVCEEVDRNYVREPYEDSLVRVCKEIRRKVKGALWI